MANLNFDPVVDDYERARPTYPDGVFDALGDLQGALVVEGGARTGIATRALRTRGASVLALDIGEAMLGRNDGMRAVADAVRMPVRDGSVDLVCFAQAWHWLDLPVASREVARVLDVGGRWAAWWVREQPVDLWCVDERSKSYVGLQPNADDVLSQLESIVRDAFPDGIVRTRYETWLWQAARR